MDKNSFVFQEVDNETATNKGKPAKLSRDRRAGSITFAVYWLSTLLAMIVCIVIVGGMTRLTDSGLSIVEWKPISGALFPLNEQHWLAEFEKYQLIPEFVLVNSEMTLAEFKYIYFWEWGHRQLGRAIGLVWCIGFLWLAFKKQIPSGWGIKFLLIGGLIGLQGFIGWWMVYSGLMPEMTDVASYRLATHLGMAFCIAGLILWFVLSLQLDTKAVMLRRRGRDKILFMFMNIYLIAVFLQIILGALVAGIDAGTAYTDWPFMAGEFFPSDYWAFDGTLENFLENPANVQFNHRMSAYFLIFVGLVTFAQSRKNPITPLKRGHTMLFIILLSEALLGILTVTYGAPYQLAIVHQLLALILWGAVVWIRFVTSFPRRQVLVWV